MQRQSYLLLRMTEDTLINKVSCKKIKLRTTDFTRSTSPGFETHIITRYNIINAKSICSNCGELLVK